MLRVKIGLFVLGVVFLISGCALKNAKDSCMARGGIWSEYDAIGKKIWPGRCVNATISHKEHCDQIKWAIKKGSFTKLPDYCK